MSTSADQLQFLSPTHLKITHNVQALHRDFAPYLQLPK